MQTTNSILPPLYKYHLPNPPKSTSFEIPKENPQLSTTDSKKTSSMGICSSCESTSVATAKLILIDGQLLEYSYPIKVSYVLQKHPSSFICNSDEMDFNDFVSAINSDEELQPGQLYFLLPLNKLKKRLQPEEIAALAVKASSALMKSTTMCKNTRCKCRRKSVTPVMFEMKSSRSENNDVEILSEKTKMRRKFGSGRNFTSDLGAIAE